MYYCYRAARSQLAIAQRTLESDEQFTDDATLK